MSFANPNTQYLFIKPPLKGSFPLDHDSVCSEHVAAFIACLKLNRGDHATCKSVAKEYFRCRMENDLMAVEEWERLGFESD